MSDPPWVRAALSIENVELVPLSQVKEPAKEGSPEWTYHHGSDDYDECVALYDWDDSHTHDGDVSEAGFTCENCPNPRRPVQTTGEAIYTGKNARRVEPTVWVYTKRCTDCERNIKRWLNGRSMAKRAIRVATTLPEAVRVALVTLTAPNYPQDLSEADAIRRFKKEVAGWRRTQGVLNHAAGGIDYYEVTTNKDDGSRNAHCHGLWVMTSWYDQKQMTKDWGRGWVWIEEVQTPQRAAYYCTAYSSKKPVSGVRTKETWGACRGKTYERIASGGDAIHG